MPSNNEITLDSLVFDELAGKSAAIASYDNMLWKIRTGYAALLYGSVGIIVGLVNKSILDLSLSTLFALGLLIIGLSIFGAFMDLSFMESKLRVVNYRDELMELAFEKAKSGNWPEENKMLLQSLKNSGERKEGIDWNNRTGKRGLHIYYGGTCLVCTVAIVILAQ